MVTDLTALDRLVRDTVLARFDARETAGRIRNMQRILTVSLGPRDYFKVIR
jgi:hypothetical protein